MSNESLASVARFHDDEAMTSSATDSSSRDSREVGIRVLNDPLSIRALAHPLRLDLLTIVGRHGSITAAEAARELEISHALASHHFKQLAKYGFVEQVDGKDRKERPWRALQTSNIVDPATLTAQASEAAELFQDVIAERSIAQLVSWRDHRRKWPDAWRRARSVSQYNVYLTSEEVVALREKVEGVIRELVDSRPLSDLSKRPPGSVPVELTFLSIPLGPAPAAAS